MINSIAVCGVGRLGLPLALNFERSGKYSVIGFDNNSSYVEALNRREFNSDEPGVNDLLRKSGMFFSHEIESVLDSDVAVVCVRTDSVSSGAYDLSQLLDFISKLTKALNERKEHSLCSLIVNCNVNPGTTRLISELLSDYSIDVYFWPEWVKQGSIVHDQTFPPVTVLGHVPGSRTIAHVTALVKSLDASGRSTEFRLLGLIEAEICKVSLNCFLTIKISFANMIANLLEELGLESLPVLEALSHDPRIGGAFLRPGFGYGGPCLPRDNKALIAFADDFGINLPLCHAADAVNEQRHQHLSKHAVKSFHTGSHVPRIETLSYKSGIPIFTESQPLRFAQQMSKLGIPSEVVDKLTLDRASRETGVNLIIAK